MAKAKKTFEQALEALENIVTEIEQGKVPLEASIDKYAEGIRLIQQCRQILQAAEKKIQLLTKGQDEQLVAAGEREEPPDPET